jgi:hypothetical protein
MAARPAKVVGKPGNARLNHVGTLYNTFATAPRVNDLTPTTPLCEGLCCAAQQFSDLDVRFGSKADIGRRLGNVRFTPESGHR